MYKIFTEEELKKQAEIIALYFEKKNKFCDQFGNDCMKCPLHTCCRATDADNLYKQLLIMSNVKTRQDALLEVLPNIVLDNGIIDICPAAADTNVKTCGGYINCFECKNAYWNEIMEEQNGNTAK